MNAFLSQCFLFVGQSARQCIKGVAHALRADGWSGRAGQVMPINLMSLRISEDMHARLN